MFVILLCSMDHGLNASTFTARVTASTEATLSDAVTAALCSLKGPLHGGAPGPVLDMLDGDRSGGRMLNPGSTPRSCAVIG